MSVWIQMQRGKRRPPTLRPAPMLDRIAEQRRTRDREASRQSKAALARALVRKEPRP